MHPFGQHIRILTKLVGYSLLLLTAMRIAQLVAFTPDALSLRYAPDLVRAFWMGLRFDAKVVSILHLPTLLIALGAQLARRPLGGDTPICVVRWYGFSMLLLLVAIGVVNLFYYQFYQEPLGIAAFGLVYDDTLAVLHSMWTDFPVVWVLLGLLGFVWALIKWTGKWVKHPGWHTNRRLRILLAISLPVLFLGLARGTVGDRPLGDGHSVVSGNMQINHLTMNAPMAAQYAWKKFNTSRSDEKLSDILRRNGFASVEEALRIYLNRQDSSGITLNALLATLPDRVDTLRVPHIVILQMESMGSYYMHFNREPFNLLGSLKKELPHLLWFPNCLSAAGGTMVSMEAILFGSPFRNISQTAYSKIPLPYSAPGVYRKAGYKTWYITGQKLGWQNIFNFYSHQAFDRIEGDVDLLQFDSNAPTGEWGVHDETLFRRIESILQNSDGQEFIYAMSISHHTPYDVPSSKFSSSMVVPDSVGERIRCDRAVAERSFIAFRYAADALGDFLQKVRKTAWGRRTIVAITGDHTLKQTLQFGDHPLDMYGVPILYYIPPSYYSRLGSEKVIDTTIYASHHDILPTLYRLSIYGEKYLQTGYSMLDTSHLIKSRLAIYDNTMAIGEDHVVDWKRKYYATTSSAIRSLTLNQTPTQEQARTIEWLKAREVCMAAFLMQYWNVNSKQGE